MQRIITSLPSNNAPGCDKVNAKILKDSSPVIDPLVAVENPLFLANKFNEFYANVRKVTAMKATLILLRNTISTFEAQRKFIHVNLSTALVKIVLPCLRFNPSLRAMCRGLLRVYRLTKLPVAIK